MKTQLELWKIVRDNFDRFWGKHGTDGLCLLLLDLKNIELISHGERVSLSKEMIEYDETKNYDGYWLGEEGDPKPRKEFIEKMIKKHSK